VSEGLNGIRVRRADAGDSAALAGLRWDCTVEGQVAPVVSREEFERGFAGWMRGAGARHQPYLAEAGGQAVGMAWLAVVDRVPEPAAPSRAGGDLQSVFVLPRFRGRGVGSELIAAVVADAAARGLMFLSVRAGRRSTPLYRRLGFAGNGQVLELVPVRATGSGSPG
jgi:GNAT superfamily N-acetyltransferase